MIRKYKRVLCYINFAGFILICCITLGIELGVFSVNIKSKHIFRISSNINISEKLSVKTPFNRNSLEQKHKTLSNKKHPLDNIPSVSDSMKSEQVQRLSDNITRKFLELPDIKYKENIAILTPVRNTAVTLDHYRLLLSKLTYPHELLSVYFGEDGSTDRSFEEANKAAHHLKTKHSFRQAAAIRLNISGGFNGPNFARHEENQQIQRRAHMALARNRLLHYALPKLKFGYTLWIDGDVAEFPTDLVQQMLFAKSDVVATSCLQKNGKYKWKYDRNSWRETNASVQEQSRIAPDGLVLEGYRKTLRVHLPDLRAEGRVVALDGVGGCALMVKADCFRSGLQFPEVVYKHHIETEGLAKMARDMGYTVVGLPFVEVIHEMK